MQIQLWSHCLYVFDIDDTLLHFPEYPRKWWIDTTEKYRILGHIDPDASTLDEWITRVEYTKGRAIDKNGFLQFYKQIKDAHSHVVLLTARPSFMKEVTLRHLEEGGIGGLIGFGDVHFDKNKGGRLRHLVQEIYTDVEKIVFVDDYKQNIYNVISAFEDSKYELDTYLYRHELGKDLR
jgi:hypothetical protein